VRAGGKDGWLLAHAGNRFVALLFVDSAPDAGERAAIHALAGDRIPVHVCLVLPPGATVPAGFDAVVDVQDLARRRFDARGGSCVLLRPDQHVAARWRKLDAAAVRAAVQRATAQGAQEGKP
jgi:3-(3-hydroxy-phenyl)propionate hydroxylase